jgi:hypothetical protein
VPVDIDPPKIDKTVPTDLYLVTNILELGTVVANRAPMRCSWESERNRR